MAKRGKGQPKTRNTVRSDEPSPRDLEIYRELCRGRTLRDVGEEFGLAHNTIHDIREKVRRYLIPKLQREIMGIKADQTNSLEHIFCECMEAWEKSKTPPTEEIDHVDAEGETTHTLKKKSTAGEPAFINQARGALADIRSLWGIDKHYELQGQDALNPSGMDREDYQLKIAQAQLNEAKQLIKELKQQGVKSE